MYYELPPPAWFYLTILACRLLVASGSSIPHLQKKRRGCVLFLFCFDGGDVVDDVAAVFVLFLCCVLCLCNI